MSGHQQRALKRRRKPRPAQLPLGGSGGYAMTTSLEATETYKLGITLCTLIVARYVRLHPHLAEPRIQPAQLEPELVVSLWKERPRVSSPLQPVSSQSGILCLRDARAHSRIPSTHKWLFQPSCAGIVNQTRQHNLPKHHGRWYMPPLFQIGFQTRNLLVS